MKKLKLNEIADEFTMINSESSLFYNTETGKFEYYGEYMDLGDDDIEKYEDDIYIAAPSQWDLDEYNIMEEFVGAVTDPHKNELLSVAIEGRGAFRRFKDTLYRVDLIDLWYTFKNNAFIEIAREWCERNGIEYVENATANV
ncbi:MAG: UPF0158 family protein [Oscillospiraceae bacterium]|jgi:hypothetical protein|nr:UPF0158 family protein [Oscillospiraceae bacterium]